MSEWSDGDSQTPSGGHVTEFSFAFPWVEKASEDEEDEEGEEERSHRAPRASTDAGAPRGGRLVAPPAGPPGHQPVGLPPVEPR